MQSKTRSFIAIQLTNEIHANLAEFSRKYNLNRHAGFRPVDPENIHLTLKFLGDASFDQINEVKMELTRIVSETHTFSIVVHGVGAFPYWDRPKTIWGGVEAPEQLENLYKQIDNATEKIGFLSEGRRFTPHLTIARVPATPSTPARQNAILSIRNIVQPPFFGEMAVNSITLFKSILQPNGPCYSPLSKHVFLT